MQINTWTHPTTGQTRRYVNDWANLIGLEIERYKTGNIRHAYLNGERISNRQAGMIAGAKVWLDEAGAVHVDYLGSNNEGVTEDMIREAVLAELAPAEETETEETTRDDEAEAIADVIVARVEDGKVDRAIKRSSIHRHARQYRLEPAGRVAWSEASLALSAAGITSWDQTAWSDAHWTGSAARARVVDAILARAETLGAPQQSPAPTPAQEETMSTQTETVVLTHVATHPADGDQPIWDALPEEIVTDVPAPTAAEALADYLAELERTGAEKDGLVRVRIIRRPVAPEWHEDSETVLDEVEWDSREAGR